MADTLDPSNFAAFVGSLRFRILDLQGVRSATGTVVEGLVPKRGRIEALRARVGVSGSGTDATTVQVVRQPAGSPTAVTLATVSLPAQGDQAYSWGFVPGQTALVDQFDLLKVVVTELAVGAGEVHASVEVNQDFSDPALEPVPTVSQIMGGDSPGGGGEPAGWDGNPANLANRLLWMDGSDTSQAGGDPATGITGYTSKDAFGAFYNVLSGTVTMTGGAFNFSGSHRFEYVWSDGDPLYDAFVRNLTGTIFGRSNGEALARVLIDFGTGNSTTADGVLIGTTYFYVNGDAAFDSNWEAAGGGSLPRLSDPGTIYDFMLVLDGAGITAYINDASEEILDAYTPAGAGPVSTQPASGFGAIRFGSGAFTGDIYQMVATSDLLTADDFAAFRAWSP